MNCVSFHPDGQSVVTGSWDAALCIWDVSTRKRKAVSETWLERERGRKRGEGERGGEIEKDREGRQMERGRREREGGGE